MAARSLPLPRWNLTWVPLSLHYSHVSCDDTGETKTHNNARCTFLLQVKTWVSVSNCPQHEHPPLQGTAPPPAACKIFRRESRKLVGVVLPHCRGVVQSIELCLSFLNFFGLVILVTLITPKIHGHAWFADADSALRSVPRGCLGASQGKDNDFIMDTKILVGS